MSDNKVTAFNNIFESRIHHIIKKIKVLRKKKASKDEIKALLKEAKELRQKVKKASKKQPIYTIFVRDGAVEFGDGLEMNSVSNFDGTLEIRFVIK